MKIIKDKQLVDDHWTFIPDNEDSAATLDNISVSLERWKQEKEQLLTRHTGQLGIRLHSNDDVNEVAGDLHHIDLIELDFPIFTDGRGFSQARMLRNQYHYDGEIRAVGNFMAEQVFYLSRVGVNAFSISSEEELKVALTTLNDFSVRYQTSTQ